MPLKPPQSPVAASRLARWAVVVLALATCLPAVGCVRRRMTIVTNPPGALAYVDNQEIGITPVSAPFTYYGAREIQVVRDGSETVKELHGFDPPWYQYPVIDFVAENLWPWEIRDERIIEIEMQPQRIVPTGELLDRANSLRGSSQQGIAIPSAAPPLVPHAPVQQQVQQYAPAAPAPQTLPGPISY